MAFVVLVGAPVVVVVSRGGPGIEVVVGTVPGPTGAVVALGGGAVVAPLTGAMSMAASTSFTRGTRLWRLPNEPSTTYRQKARSASWQKVWTPA